MLKFRPITYADEDRRAFKYTGTSAVLEGAFCKLAASTGLNTVTCTLASGAAGTLAGATATAISYNAGQVFPIYREDPDIDNVGATISQNDFVVGMALRPGSEFEIHKTALHRETLASFAAVGDKVCLGTTGKLCRENMTNSTGMVIGECMGTLNATWLRVRAI